MTQKTYGNGEWGDLYPLLIRVQTKREVETLDVPKLAETCKMSEEGVYKWLRSNKLPFKKAEFLCEKSKGRVTIEEFLPFIA